MEAPESLSFILEDEFRVPTRKIIEFGGRSFNSADFMNSVEWKPLLSFGAQ